MNRYIVEYAIKPGTEYSRFGEIKVTAKSSPFAERIAAHKVKRAYGVKDGDISITRVIGVHSYRVAAPGKIPA